MKLQYWRGVLEQLLCHKMRQVVVVVVVLDFHARLTSYGRHGVCPDKGESRYR